MREGGGDRTPVGDVGGGRIHRADLAYMRGRLGHRLYDLVASEFERARRDSGLTVGALATRLGRDPEVVAAWMSGPGDWTLDVVSDLLLGISGSELAATATAVPVGTTAPPTTREGRDVGR